MSERTILITIADERAWTAFAAGALADPSVSAEVAAEVADETFASLVERRATPQEKRDAETFS